MIRSFLLSLSLLGILLPCLAQIPDAPAPTAAREGYTGDEACTGCHQQQADPYRNTAHHIASRLPTQQSIKGNFTPGENVLRTANPYLYFAMSAEKGTFFQTAFVTLPPSETIAHREPFDLVIGSGRKGQTYLYWEGNALFELPVSYWTETNQWINSPGYHDGLPNFDKPIIARCLECHTSFAGTMKPTGNQFNRESLVLGITCERCHGPGRAHVLRTRANIALQPGAVKDIINPARLPRDRQIDLCALCHASPGTPKGASFSFVAGQNLSQYLSLPDAAPDAPSDVHGHQVQQLRNSRCYLSTSMTCSTCHNVHTPQRDVAAFSQKCLGCHQAQSCGRYAALGTKILENCVNCHMPLKQSEQIVIHTSNGKIRPQIRTHRIAVYPASRLELE